MKWQFIHGEQIPDTISPIHTGVISDGQHCLFYVVNSKDENSTETCHIYSSILMGEQTQECEYPWNAENDQILLGCLNSLSDPSDYCGEGSPIRTLKFKQDLRGLSECVFDVLCRNIDEFDETNFFATFRVEWNGDDCSIDFYEKCGSNDSEKPLFKMVCKDGRYD